MGAASRRQWSNAGATAPGRPAVSDQMLAVNHLCGNFENQVTGLEQNKPCFDPFRLLAFFAYGIGFSVGKGNKCL